MKVLVVGAGGHLGAGVVEHLAPVADVTATTRATLDVCDHRAVSALVSGLRPDAVVNCAAYTDVDRAEDEPVEALNVNAFAVRVMAAAAASVGAAFVHYSTDFVFDGTGERPYTEDDQPNPRSTYACSKLVGEWFAREAPRHYVLRVESVFGALPAGPGARRTSVDRIVDALLGGEVVRVFTDRTVSPSYHRDVADATQALLDARGAARPVSLREQRKLHLGGPRTGGRPPAWHRAPARAGADGGRQAAGESSAVLRALERATGIGGNRHAELARRARQIPRSPAVGPARRASAPRLTTGWSDTSRLAIRTSFTQESRNDPRDHRP